MNSDSLAALLSLTASDLNNIRAARIGYIEEKIGLLASTKVVLKEQSSLDSYSIQELAYSIAKRAADIIKAMKPAIREDQVIPVVIMARALLETVALGCLFFSRIEKHLVAKDYDGLAKTFVKFYAGGSAIAPLKGFHVNDGLRLLEKHDLAYYQQLATKYPQFGMPVDKDALDNVRATASVQTLYNSLSEIAHPNGFGLQYLYPAEDAPPNEEIKQKYRYLSGAAVWQCCHVIRQLEAFRDFDQRYNDVFPKPQGFSAAMKQSGITE